ncbi:MAG: RNA polymerase sigma factor [Planctomycetes bacterium]|nr:RNA polymerase sigma factor [Planctomycetota bacterium]
MPVGPAQPDPDVALMLALQAGDESALGVLIERNGRSVLNLAYRYLGDRSAAEDVLQESFLKLYQARERYRPEARLRTYLLRIATNLCISRLRKKRPSSLDGHREEGEGGIDPADPEAPAPNQSLLTGELHERVRAAVMQLPERQRIAILLNKFEGLDYKETAAQIGLSVPATKSLLHRARMALKDALAEYVDE